MIRSSGIGTIIANITPRLISRNRNWKFQIAGDPEDIRRFDWAHTANVEIVAYRAPIYSIGEQIAFPAQELSGSEILWSPNYNIPLRWKGKLIVNVNDLAHLTLPEMKSSTAKQLFARFMFRTVRNRADAIVYISQFSSNEFQRLVGTPCGRETVIPCGVGEEWFQPAGAPPLRDRPYVLFVGNVKPHKNLSRLLDAYWLIKDDIDHDLMIVGRKEGFITGDNDVIRRVETFAGRVAFTGYVSDDVLKSYFAGADALILPSLYEGFGLPPVEAMAAGCPALVSRTASLPEVCRDAALYCDPLDVKDIAEKLRQIITDRNLRQRLKKQGLTRARELNWNVAVEAYERVINGLTTALPVGF